MYSYSCFWGLLTTDSFEFVYISKNIRDLGPKLNRNFINSSLFDFIDPVNVTRLQKDLESFLSRSGFNGGSIRIKARNFWSTYYFETATNFDANDSSLSDPQPFITYNVSMQVITPSIVLALFHVEEEVIRKRCSYFKVNCFHQYDQEEIDLVNSCLEESTRNSRRLPSLKALHSFPNTPSILSPTSPGFPLLSVDTRSFLIYDSQTPQLLLAWPTENYLRLTGQAPQSRPSSSLDSLLHSRDINRLMSGVSTHLQFNRHHLRINFMSDFANASGSKIEQIVYILGNITIACSQLAISGTGSHSLQNQLHPSKSLSFTNQFNSNNSQFTIQRKISAPVLSNNGFPALPPCSDIEQDTHAPLAKKRSTELTSLHNYSFSRPKSSSTLAATREQDCVGIPRKSVSNESFRRLESHTIPNNAPKSSNRLLSFLSPSRPLSLNLANRFRRSNSKSGNTGVPSSDSSTALPSISQICSQGFPESERGSQGTHTTLPGISKLFSRLPDPPSSQAQNYPFSPLENSYGSLGRLRPSHSSLTSPPLTSPLLNGPNRVCLSCGTTNSPEWRRGPKGQKTLCNACGLKYSRQLKAARLQHQADMDASQFS